MGVPVLPAPPPPPGGHRDPLGDPEPAPAAKRARLSQRSSPSPGRWGRSLAKRSAAPQAKAGQAPTAGTGRPVRSPPLGRDARWRASVQTGTVGTVSLLCRADPRSRMMARYRGPFMPLDRGTRRGRSGTAEQRPGPEAAGGGGEVVEEVPVPPLGEDGLGRDEGDRPLVGPAPGHGLGEDDAEGRGGGAGLGGQDPDRPAAGEGVDVRVPGAHPLVDDDVDPVRAGGLVPQVPQGRRGGGRLPPVPQDDEDRPLGGREARALPVPAPAPVPPPQGGPAPGPEEGDRRRGGDHEGDAEVHLPFCESA